jgi:hypothetical protein
LDRNELLGVVATFERVALALDRDGLTTESLERVTAWGPVGFGRRVEDGTDGPYVVLRVAHMIVDVRNVTGHPADLLASALREIVAKARAELRATGDQT